MGSKKHKEKDREHRRKHKHRSRSKEKHHSKRSRAEKEERRARKKAAEAYLSHRTGNVDEADDVTVTEIDYGHGYKHYESNENNSSAYTRDGLLHDVKPVKQEPQSEDEAPYTKQGSSNNSLSIEETNKLRVKLGLKPLDVAVPGVKDEENAEKSKKQDVHVPAINLGERKRTEKIRERVDARRNKRDYEKKLSKVKGLGDSDSDDDGAFAWVKKSRLLQRERELAAAREKILDEMDAEFGLADIVDEEFHKNKQQDYSAKELTGLTVQHTADRFKEGKTVILTLDDKRILDDDGDVLVNVNMIDDEFVEKQLQTKKKGPQYNPYEDNVDEFDMPKAPQMLSKYDETISGIQKKSFTLGSAGKYADDNGRMLSQMRQDLQSRQVSLTLGAPQLARDYYSNEEMAEKFKRTKKKKRKIRGETTLKADDLLDGNEPGEHHGSRTRGRGVNADEPVVSDDQDGLDPSQHAVDDVSQAAYTYYGDDTQSVSWPRPEPKNESQPEKPVANDSDSDTGPLEDLSQVVIVDPDDTQSELQASLDKTRRLKNIVVSKKPDEKVLRQLRQYRREEEMAFGDKNSIVLNSISEFCRSLGDIPTYGQAGNREEDDDMMDLDDERGEAGDGEEDAMTGWNEVDVDSKPVDIEEDEDNILDDEPVVNKGVGTALLLAVNKGYLEKEASKMFSAKQLSKIQVQNYSIEDKRYDDLDDKVRKRERDRYTGALADFKDKSGYRPDIKLEYMDDKGNLLNHKEAFRYLSHRFHGKGSGKKKTEKRSRKADDDLLMKQMSSIDTPLGTLNLLKEKQKSEKSPYVILTGVSSNKAFMANTITK